MQISEENIEQFLDKIFNRRAPEFSEPVIVFESKDNKTLYPSGLLEDKDAEAYADWWMDNQ